MSKSFSNSYKEAGVDITAGYRSVEMMKQHIAKTMIFGNTSDVGGFGGLMELDTEGMEKPVLVSGTDGVGNPEKIAMIVKGVADGCVQSESALVGGETAEMPGFYPEDEYDLAGFAVGIVDKKNVLDKNNVKEGDVLIALPSSGVHSNGFSLVRKVFDVESADISKPVTELGGRSIGEVLLTPTKIYVKPVLALLKEVKVKSIAHITGGGFYENIPRSLPEGLGAVIKRDDIKVLPIFDLIAKEGNIPERDMFNTFNMGVGMTIIVSKDDIDKTIKVLKENGEDAYVLGTISKSDEGVEIC